MFFQNLTIGPLILLGFFFITVCFPFEIMLLENIRYYSTYLKTNKKKYNQAKVSR